MGGGQERVLRVPVHTLSWLTPLNEGTSIRAVGRLGPCELIEPDRRTVPCIPRESRQRTSEFTHCTHYDIRWTASTSMLRPSFSLPLDQLAPRH